MDWGSDREIRVCRIGDKLRIVEISEQLVTKPLVNHTGEVEIVSGGGGGGDVTGHDPAEKRVLFWGGVGDGDGVPVVGGEWRRSGGGVVVVPWVERGREGGGRRGEFCRIQHRCWFTEIGGR